MGIQSSSCTAVAMAAPKMPSMVNGSVRQSRGKAALPSRTAKIWLERSLFMVFLHGETAGLHLAKLTTSGYPSPFVQRGNGCCDREAEAAG
ncbi:MAG: hypothetical protein ACLSFT_03365 [Ruminococcus callidus]